MISEFSSHGTWSAYVQGCRCEPCKKAAREYGAAYRTRTAGQCPDEAHGTLRGYNHYRCRCDLCVTAKAEDFKKRYQPAPEKVFVTVDLPKTYKHGTYSAYAAHGCRCAPCREAGQRYRRNYYQRTNA